MEYWLNKLSTYIRGWMGYFVIAEAYRDIPEIDGWIRRQVRLCYWKQWRWCRTKIRELLKLGTERFTAIRAGLNRSGPWAMARRLATHTGMTNSLLSSSRARELLIPPDGTFILCVKWSPTPVAGR